MITAPPSAAAPTGAGGIPVLGHLLPLMVKRMAFIQSLRAQGDLVWIRLGTHPVCVVNSPELIHRVLVTEARKFEKGLIFDKMRPFLGNGLVTSTHTHHRRQRRLVQPAFHRERITRYGDLMLRCVDERIADWRPDRTVRVDIEMQNLVVDVLAGTLFASGAGKRAAEEMHRSLPAFNQGLTRRTLSPPFMDSIPTPAIRRFNTAAARLRSVVEEMIAAYREAGTDHGDLLSMLLSARDADTGDAMTDEEIRDEVINLLIAGMETTNSTLAWICHVLGRHPEVDQRVYAEVRAAAGDHPVQAATLPELRYTRRVVCEVLRLYHPLWLVMRRSTAPVALGDVTLPPGTDVVFSPATLHRDPVLYPDPLRFDPDRWPLPQTETLRHAFIPFGAGSRQCIGDGFAWTELTLATAHIVSRWKLRPATGHNLRPGNTVVIHPGRLPMIPTPRVEDRSTTVVPNTSKHQQEGMG
ncbi:cytochrome P450 [Streptomyces albicerus]|uniref:cytochrome P450 n=1 Tax=Streptomyces albicerus TaxID=2569859 RepID=UPI00124B7708|nr:cytochrome P450 [Streptomyces albicerus]